MGRGGSRSEEAVVQADGLPVVLAGKRLRRARPDACAWLFRAGFLPDAICVRTLRHITELGHVMRVNEGLKTRRLSLRRFESNTWHQPKCQFGAPARSPAFAR